MFGYTAQMAFFKHHNIGITDKQIVQVDQVLKFVKPVTAGDKLYYDVYLHEIRQAHGTDIIVTRNVVTNPTARWYRRTTLRSPGGVTRVESGFKDGTA